MDIPITIKLLILQHNHVSQYLMISGQHEAIKLLLSRITHLGRSLSKNKPCIYPIHHNTIHHSWTRRRLRTLGFFFILWDLSVAFSGRVHIENVVFNRIFKCTLLRNNLHINTMCPPHLYLEVFT